MRVLAGRCMRMLFGMMIMPMPVSMPVMHTILGYFTGPLNAPIIFFIDSFNYPIKKTHMCILNRVYFQVPFALPIHEPGNRLSHPYKLLYPDHKEFAKP